MSEILVAVIATYMFTRLSTWSFKPTARQAGTGAALATVGVLLLAIVLRLTTQQGAAEGATAHTILLYETCVLGWLGVDLWRVGRSQRLALEAKERALERQEERIKEESRQWGRVLREAELRDGPLPAKELASAGNACPACGATVLPDAKFCDGCGSKLTNECPKCQGTNREGARFCKQCGFALSRAADA